MISRREFLIAAATIAAPLSINKTIRGYEGKQAARSLDEEAADGFMAISDNGDYAYIKKGRFIQVFKLSTPFDMSTAAFIKRKPV